MKQRKPGDWDNDSDEALMNGIIEATDEKSEQVRERRTTLYIKYFPLLVRYLCNRFPLSNFDAEDIAQKSLEIGLLKKYKSFHAKGPGSFQAWQWTIAKRLAINEMKSAYVQRTTVMSAVGVEHGNDEVGQQEPDIYVQSACAETTSEQDIDALLEDIYIDELCQEWKLTSNESALLKSIVDGVPPREIADEQSKDVRRIYKAVDNLKRKIRSRADKGSFN